MPSAVDAHWLTPLDFRDFNRSDSWTAEDFAVVRDSH